jgi:hypothetical protein
MAINTSTVETNLTTKLNATSGSTEAKEFLLLGKAVEALQPSVTVTSIQNEGATQVAAVQAAGSGYAALTGANFTGDITTTGKILYSNVYSALGDLPSAATYHGMFAHVHAENAGFFAHGGNWLKLVNYDTSGNVTIGGNLTVSGTTVTVNSTTLDVADKNITIAKGAADAATASGAGLTVDGASATLTYTSTTDTWDFNKAVTGTYTNLHPVVQTDTTPSGAHTLDMNKPMHHITMFGGATYFTSNKAAGKTAMMVLDTSTTPHTPLWHGSFKWPSATEPTWSDSRYWAISMTCLDSTNVLASAQAYTV